MQQLAQFLNEALPQCKNQNDQQLLKQIVRAQLERCPSSEARQAFVDELETHVDTWVRSGDEMQQFLYETDISTLSSPCQSYVKDLVLGLGEVVSHLVKWQSRCELQKATVGLNESLKKMQEASPTDEFRTFQTDIVNTFTEWRASICDNLGEHSIKAWREIATKAQGLVQLIENNHFCHVEDMPLLRAILQRLVARCPHEEIKKEFANL